MAVEDGYAVFSEDRVYRYALWRLWDSTKPAVVFIMLNPSTADGQTDDPTIRKCVGFTKRWGGGALVVVNLFAFRATDPKVLMAHHNEEYYAGRVVDAPNNEYWIDSAIEGKICPNVDKIVCAWGPKGTFLRGSDRMRRFLSNKPLWAIRLAKGGEPCHPLMLPYSEPLKPYNAKAWGSV